MSTDKDILSTYKSLYGLPELTHKERVNFDFFRLCKENYKFAVICIYNERRELLLQRDINKNIGWELVGGYIYQNERIEEAINRIALKEVGLITIDELQPIAILNNIFEWNDRIIAHRGIAFIALSRGPIKPQPENIKVIYTREIPGLMLFQNKKVFLLAKKIIRSKSFEPPYEEIESGKFFVSHIFNKHLTKVISWSASKKIKRQILNLIHGHPKSILDVSCGDDDLILELEKKFTPELCVANDISWEVISLLQKKIKKSRIIFTNHNVLTLPFIKKFDLLLFKNTLHHIPAAEQINLIKRLSSLSKQLIIIDIEDPNRSNFLTKIWNWYYRYLLGDQGGYFITLEELEQITKKNIADKKITSGVINTVKGRYFFISLSEITQREEVEVKVKIEAFQINNIRKKLLALGAILEERIKESDSYFTAPHRDFIKTKECLRVRETSGYLELTYKGPTTSSMDNRKQFWKTEINIPLRSSKKEVELLLDSLNFTKVVEVVKNRERFILGRQKITFDNIKNLGWFLEIENIITNEQEREKALDENINLLKELGLNKKDIITEPYRDLVLQQGEH